METSAVIRDQQGKRGREEGGMRALVLLQRKLKIREIGSSSVFSVCRGVELRAFGLMFVFDEKDICDSSDS